MTSSPLESLPNEILFPIIVHVDFSYQNFRALLLTCHRIFDLIQASGLKLFEDIAATQYPHALDAQRYPIIPFPGHSTVPSIARLDMLRTASEIVERGIRLMRLFRAVLLKTHSEHLKYLVTRGWDQNLRSAFHLAMFLPLFNNQTNAHCRYFPHSSARPPVPSDFSAVLNSVPAHYILAYRHAICMIVETEYLINGGTGHPLRDELELAGSPSPPARDRRLQDSRWQLLRLTSMPFSLYPRYPEINQVEQRCERWSWAKRWRQIILPFGNVKYCDMRFRLAITESLSQRTRKILEDWDQLSQDPGITENLQPANGIHDIEAVRKLVQSFVPYEAATI
jgi:hypothetical protein